MDRLYIDTLEFARLGRKLEGRAPLQQFSRLVGDLPAQAGDAVVSWSLSGESTLAGLSFLDVRVQACVTLLCQRCLSPFEYPVDSRNRLQLVKFEADLEDESDLDEDEIERIVGSKRFDVLELVEDELILGLPYVPRHEVCPSDPTLPYAGAKEVERNVRPSPFAVLGKLKKD